MSDRKVYEVVDYSGETYYPLGIFETLYQAKHEINKLESPDHAISEFVYDYYERIVIIERRIGWSGNGKQVYETEREEFYNEEQEKYSWRRVNQTPAPAFPEIASQINS